MSGMQVSFVSEAPGNKIIFVSIVFVLSWITLVKSTDPKSKLSLGNKSNCIVVTFQ
jgi:hypothetical protein